MIKSIPVLLLLLCVCSCVSTKHVFRTDQDFITKDGKPFLVKGVVYVPVYPGQLPWEIKTKTDLPETYKDSIRKDIQDIKEMGANTIRLWDAPAFCYEAIREAGEIFFIQTIWFPVDADDLQDPAYKNNCKTEIRRTIDRIYSAYSEENPPPILAILVGNELSDRSVEDTNDAHPEITSYQGTYVSARQGASPSECFIAEMADYVKTYEKEQYKNQHLVSYANEIRTQDIIDTPFLDFRCYNAYPYAIYDYARPEYMLEGKSGFLAWIEYLKKKHPDKPLLITETGLSVSPEAQHAGEPHYGYGGNTEEEQGAYLVEAWNNILISQPPIAGMCIHEYLDAWWKFGKKDSLEHNADDVEEWFGLVSTGHDGSWYRTTPRKAYLMLQKVWRNAEKHTTN